MEGKSLSGPVRFLPDREAALFKSIGTQSAFASPIHINGTPWGFALFEDLKKERVFDDELSKNMQSAAFLFANAVVHAELEEQLASERNFTQKIFDAAPIGINIWDDNFNIIDCNDAIPNIFGTSKQDYIDNFFKFSPEYQPDGVKTITKGKELQSRGQDGEIVVVEWTHCTATGEPIPCEITMARVDYNNRKVLLVYLYDLRNIKKMEEAALNSKQMQVLIDATPLSCTLLDKNANILTCNKSAMDLFKLSKKDDIHRLFVDLIPEYQPDGRNSREVVVETLKKAYDGGYLFYPDWMHKSMDGELLPCEITIVRVEFGGDYALACYVRDMRAVKEAEAKANEADKRAQLMLEYAPIVVMLWDTNFHILDCNQESIKIFGLANKEEFIEKFMGLAPEYQPNGMTSQEMFLSARSMILDEKEFVRMELTIKHAVSGEAIPFAITLVRIEYKDGYAILAYGHDLRERNTAIAKVREVDERAQILFDTAPFAGCMFDDKSNVLECNQEMVKMFGLPNKDFFINNLFAVLFPEYQPNGELSAIVSKNNGSIAFEKGYYRFECMHQKLSGEPLPAEVTMVRVRYRGEYAIAGYFRDLTEQKAAEQLTKLVMDKTSTLTAIFDSTPDMIFCKDVNLLYTECNKAMENYFNVRSSDIIGKPEAIALGIPQDIAEQLIAVDKKVLREGQAVTTEELIKTFDGRFLNFELIDRKSVV
jgi:PAS domain S-box-containing protein